MSPATGKYVPLLPEKKQGEKRASVHGAVFNVSTSIIGAGIMSIPATLKVLGVIPALVLIMIIAWLVDISVEFLLRYTQSGESTTYAGVMREVFGRVGSVSVQICVIITNLEWFGIHWWNSRAFALLFVVILVMLPLVLIRRVESLRFSSAISFLLAVIFVGICSVMAIHALIEGKTKTPRLLPHLDNKTSFLNLFTAVPVIVTAFTFHFNVHPISSELAKPSDMISAVKISLLLCAGIYFTTGIFGYLLFGESIVADILVNFDLSLIQQSVHYSMTQSDLAMPFTSCWPSLEKDSIRFVSLTLVLLVFAYLAAIAIPNIWYFFQFMGSTSAVCLAFIFPGAIVLRDVHSISTTRDKIAAAVMIILAVTTSTIALSTNIYILVRNK
ncbi:sodium-coupled neutral amino acid transporter [Salix suchowensis]|nr:sodium-coupled neutral amino acid transporter [Salix suchowensis]